MRIISSVLLALLLVVLPVGNAAAQVPETEREALISLYESTDGANWINRSNWRNASDTDFNIPGTECIWYGVTCSEGRVIRLDQLNNNLDGSIPPELGNLDGLLYLQLTNNQLSGSIPSELGNLGNLVALYLSSNQLSGDIPPQLGDLANLERIYIWSNRLTGGIPSEMGRLSNLLDLYLHTNQLSGSVPPELGDLADLRRLNLHNNLLTGSIPSELCNLGNLEVLDLSYNQFTGSIPPQLVDLGSLQHLLLGANQISGPIPSELGELTNLRNLVLTSNRLEGGIPASLGNLSDLVGLHLRSNQLTGEIPPQMANLDSLLGLDLSHNALWTEDSVLRAFLDSYEPDWSETQTVAPDGLGGTSSTSSTITLSWIPIVYSEDSGGYRVFVATNPGGPYSLVETTPEKTTSMTTVGGLSPSTTYAFIIETQTDPHAFNQNTVISDPTAEILVISLNASPIPTLTRGGWILLVLALAGIGFSMVRSGLNR